MGNVNTASDEIHKTPYKNETDALVQAANVVLLAIYKYNISPCHNVSDSVQPLPISSDHLAAN